MVWLTIAGLYFSALCYVYVNAGMKLKIGYRCEPTRSKEPLSAKHQLCKSLIEINRFYLDIKITGVIISYKKGSSSTIFPS